MSEIPKNHEESEKSRRSSYEHANHMLVRPKSCSGYLDVSRIYIDAIPSSARGGFGRAEEKLLRRGFAMRLDRAPRSTTHFLHVAVHRSHVDAQVDQAVGVTPLVVVPGHELDEVLVQAMPALLSMKSVLTTSSAVQLKTPPM